LLGGKSELGRMIERGRKRSGLRLKTKMTVKSLSCDDGPGWENWRIGLKRKFGGKNEKLLLVCTAQKDVSRQI
jgi:hypothetical protein